MTGVAGATTDTAGQKEDEGAPIPVTYRGGASYYALFEQEEQERRAADGRQPCLLLVRMLLLLLIGGLVVARSQWAVGAPFLASMVPRPLALPADLPAQLQAAVAQRPHTAVATYSALFVALMGLSMPGCTLLTMFGALAFGVNAAFPLVSVLVALGSALAFGLSRRCGAGLMHAYLPDRLSVLRPLLRRAWAGGEWRGLVMEMCFLRLSPFSASWVLNMAAPHVGCVPLSAHVVASMLGSLPRNLFTLVVALDLVALGGRGGASTTTTPLHAKAPRASVARVIVAVILVVAPLFLRSYCQMKPGSVAGYSDLYKVSKVVKKNK
jgi:uncharacterized membrane protein YdjX (TVP38/TMEM64 family)